MNSFLQKAKMEVEDLFIDLADGRKLLKLLEIISGERMIYNFISLLCRMLEMIIMVCLGEKLGKPNSGKMRVHRIENVNKSLAFLHTKVSRYMEPI